LYTILYFVNPQDQNLKDSITNIKEIVIVLLIVKTCGILGGWRCSMDEDTSADYLPLWQVKILGDISGGEGRPSLPRHPYNKSRGYTDVRVW
jgi:hypothetical protein